MSHSSIMPNPTNGKLSSPPPVEGGPTALPESEVLPRARWRSFPAEYKRRILQEADQCTQSGQVRDLLNSERFQDQTPRQVWAQLLDEGVYRCGWRTMYRILDAYKEVKERRNQLRHPSYTKPELLATGPHQLWSWDISKLKGPAKWVYYYLYV